MKNIDSFPKKIRTLFNCIYLKKKTPNQTNLFICFLQASSHSSYKSSPLPKQTPHDGDEIRRNSPANTPVGLNQSSLSIKQELLEVGGHAGLPPDLMPVS